MLTLNNVTKVFGNSKAVDDVCFSVDNPMMIGIICASGAGKSTLLRMVNVLETVTEGQISFQGTVISDLSGSATAFRRFFTRVCQSQNDTTCLVGGG